MLTSLLGLGTGNESFGTITPGPQDRGAPREEGGPFYSQWLVQVGLGVEGKGGMKAGSQAPQVLETQTSLPVAAQPGLSLSPNFHTSRTSRSMASLKLSAPSRLLVLGFGWALPEGVKGSSLLQGLGGDSGASLRPVGEREGCQHGKRKAGLFPHQASVSRSLPRTHHLLHAAGPLEDASCEVGVGVYEKKLVNSYLMPEPESTSLYSFTPFFIQPTNMLYFGQKTNLTPTIKEPTVEGRGLAPRQKP